MKTEPTIPAFITNTIHLLSRKRHARPWDRFWSGLDRQNLRCKAPLSKCSRGPQEPLFMALADHPPLTVKPSFHHLGPQGRYP
jgi:hypothetical protein